MGSDSNLSLDTTQPYYDAAPFTEWMGVVEILSKPGEVHLQVKQRHELNNRRELVHGGVLATVLDSAMARAARAHGAGVEFAATVDLHVQFMLPAEGTLVAMGLVESSSRSLAFCRGEVRNQAGVLVASATATMRLRRAG
jgi:uncharacterized protein (TIGR00369 family)